MAVQTSYPGVYVQEVPGGVRTIAGVSTSVATFIGRTRKGLVLKPYRCLNFTDFERVFSSEDPKGNSVSEIDMGRAVRLFFQNGGTDCYIVRIANGAVAAAINLTNAAAANVLSVTAKSEGTIGNTIRLSIDHNSRLPDSLFNLEVYRWVPNKNGQMIKVETERWQNLSMDPLNNQYAVKIVNEGSKLIDLAALPGAAAASSFSQAALAVSNASAAAFWQAWKEIMMGTGPVTGPRWTGTAVITPDGTYTGTTDKTFRLEVTVGGTVGTDLLAINWDDGTGNTGTVNIPAAYVAATPLAVAEGVTIALAAGTLVAQEIFLIQVINIGPVVLSGGFSGSAIVTASGAYSGAVNKTFTFTITANDGVINTDTIDVDWDDGVGGTGNFTIPVLYVPGSVIPIAEGLNLSFAAGNLVSTETFSIEVNSITAGANSTSAVAASGAFTGSAAKTFTFNITTGGIVGTDAIVLNWNDGAGATAVINLPVTYTAGTVVPVAEGLNISFTAGTLVTNGVFMIAAQPRGTAFRISVNKGLSYENVDLADIDFDTDANFNNTAAGAQMNLAPAIQTRINTALTATGTTVAVSMQPGTGTNVHLRITSATHDVQVLPASTADLAAIIQLGAPFGGTETSRYSDASPANVSSQDLGNSGQDGAATTAAEYDAAYEIMDKEIDLFNLVILPQDREHSDITRDSLWGPASVFCNKRRAFLLMDPPGAWRDVQSVTDLAGGVNRFRIGLVKDHSAIFFPRLTIREDGKDFFVGPSGAIAGLMARTDATRGVWKAAAGTDADIRGITGLEYRFSDGENGVLNPQAINTIRVFPNGIVNWGARTMDGDDDFASEWKYIPVRRTALFIEESLYRGLKWVVFEPNDEPLWAQIRMNVGAFMHNLFRQGAFQGAKKSDAYFVKCDAETTTQNDINLGVVNIWVGFAPLKPAEFVVLYLQQIAGNILV